MLVLDELDHDVHLEVHQGHGDERGSDNHNIFEFREKIYTKKKPRPKKKKKNHKKKKLDLHARSPKQLFPADRYFPSTTQPANFSTCSYLQLHILAKRVLSPQDKNLLGKNLTDFDKILI